MSDLQNTSATPEPTERFEVLIAGGGVAGLEAAFALREFAGERVALSILAPTDEFVYRPMSVAEPFSSGWAEHYPLAPLAVAAGATLVRDALVQVDAEHRQVHTASGAELSYDALLICLGATVHERYERATLVDDAHMDDLLHGLVQDIEGGYVHTLAFVVPDPMPWPLPVYELALMASERAWDMQADLSITVLTPEKAPLAIFGNEVSLALSRLLAERKIEVVTASQCDVPKNKEIRIHPGDRTIEADRIVALPELRGPAIIGLPSHDGGFIPINDYAAVKGVKRVWAAGDATDFPVKQGGVAAQMAVTAARSIAALAGASVETRRFEPVLEGVLLTGGSPRFLRGRPAGGRGAPSELRKLEHGDHTPKIAARYLAPHLAGLTPVSPGSTTATGSVGAETEAPTPGSRSFAATTPTPVEETAAMTAEMTDQTAADAVRRELDWDPKINANALGVTVRDGSILLMGSVSSNAEKLAAVKAAERVYGVRAVAAEITVDLPAESHVGDAEIAETIARQLRWNTVVPDTVDADVENGFVTLRGTVEWSYQSDAAERPLNLVRGVYCVTNLITVKPHEELAADLGDRVDEALSRMADLDARSIGVAASNGTVHLQGSVRTFAERRIAEHAAAAAPGVREVSNELVVTPAGADRFRARS